MARVYLALGSNLGDRWKHLTEACRSLSALERTEVVGVSGVYETMPVGGPAGQGAFLNAVVEVVTELEAEALLEQMQRIERAAGRPARDERVYWGPRPLDLDLLFYDGQVIDRPGLKVPHPRLHERWFVLRPMADLAPEWMHPVLKRRVEDLLGEVSADPAAVRHAGERLRRAAGLSGEVRYAAGKDRM